MYDEQTVKNMITENGNYTEFRTLRVDPKRDYLWNTKQIQSAVTSGILQGKGIKDLTDSFMTVMQRNRNAAIRNARTAYTSAQNGGRMASLRQAKAQGINVRKQWLSAHDNRVRDTHAVLNGQIRDIEEEFDNGLLYPADSSGAPAEVYNCRCTLTYIYPDWDTDESAEIYKSNALEGETFQEFVKRMKRESYDSNGYAMSKSVDFAANKPVPHSALEQLELTEYARKKGISLKNVSEFDGDSDLLKEQINTLSFMMTEFNFEKLKVSFRKLDADELAWTSSSGVIHFGKGVFSNRSEINDYLKEDNYLSSTDHIGIGAHEFAHVLAMKRGEKGFEIARQAYYNLFKRRASDRELLQYLNDNVSTYSLKMEKKRVRFDGKNYKEILPEIFGKQVTNPSRFTEECYRLAREVLK